MSISILSYLVLFIALALLLGFVGYEDKKEYEIHIYTILIFSAGFFICWLFFLMLNLPWSYELFLAGLIIASAVYVILRKQLASLDHYIILISSISFPFVSIPAFLTTMSLTAFMKDKTHGFIWVYFLAFMAMSLVEGTILAVALSS